MKTTIIILLCLGIFSYCFSIAGCCYDDCHGEGDSWFWGNSCCDCNDLYDDCMRSCYTTGNGSDYVACRSYCEDEVDRCKEDYCDY